MGKLTLRFRLRDKHAPDLNRQAREVNRVWNYCNETQQKAARARREWLSAFDLQRLTAGSSKLLGLHASSIQQTCQQYDESRRSKRRPWLRFRGKKSLGWVPFKKRSVRAVAPRQLLFNGQVYETMHWREMPEGVAICAGSFSQDARGRWYINYLVEMPARERSAKKAVGIDLGLKDLATLSDGQTVENHRHYRRLEDRLATAQRANKKMLVKSIHAQITNARKDYLHKVSADIAARHNVIVVGNVSPSKLTQTRMAKSVLDAGWADFKNMLSYKAIRHGGVMIEVDESYTSQTCSSCGCRPPERPRGIAGLGIREWECSECGTVHDRDVNAARNILAIGLDSLAEGAAQ